MRHAPPPPVAAAPAVEDVPLDQLRPWGRARRLFLATVLIAMVACDVYIGPGYPDRIVSPEIVGPVASIESLGDGGADVVLASGEMVRIEADDRSLGGLGDLLIAGGHPERWHLPGHRSDAADCYTLSASRGYSETTAVVLVFERWPGTGIRLPKAPGFDDRTLTTTDADGRRVFSGLGSISLCADDQGRVSSFTSRPSIRAPSGDQNGRVKPSDSASNGSCRATSAGTIGAHETLPRGTSASSARSQR